MYYEAIPRRLMDVTVTDPSVETGPYDSTSETTGPTVSPQTTRPLVDPPMPISPPLVQPTTTPPIVRLTPQPSPDTTSSPVVRPTTTPAPVAPRTTSPVINITTRPPTTPPLITAPTPEVDPMTTPPRTSRVTTSPPIEIPSTTTPRKTTPPPVEPTTTDPPDDLTAEPTETTAPPDKVEITTAKPTKRIATTLPPTAVPSNTPIRSITTIPPAIQSLPPASTSPSSSGTGSAVNRAESTSNGSDKHTIVAALGGVAVCLGLVIVIALFVIYRRRRRELPVETPCVVEHGPVTSPHVQFARLPGQPVPTLGPLPKDFRNDRVLQSVRIPLEEIALGSLLNRGAFGEVFKANYRGQTVVVKRLLRDRRLDMTETRAFAREIKLMASLQHPRIVRLIGAAWDSPSTLCAVTEYMEGGDVRSLLARLRDTRRPVGFDNYKIQIALHVVEALAYLHAREPKILHRDLKSKNIVLTATGHAKLTDFGVSRERCELFMTSDIGGSSLWMAPEVMAGGPYDEKADIFSFGVLLSELDTHMLPYRYGLPSHSRVPDVALLHRVENGSLTVSFTGPPDDMMTQTARACVARNPRDRPSASTLRVRLQAILRL